MASLSSSEYRQLREIQGRPIVDKRHGDRHKNKKRPRRVANRPTKPLTKWERRKIVAWDGEGANLADGTHVYNLLANSDGVCIINHSGLGTEEVFNFFITYGDPKAINVIYGGSYDCNMLLVDVPYDKLKVLWKTGSVYWKQWRIFYTSRKKLTVQRLYRKPNGKPGKITFVLWDVLGFFQSSFVAACRKWLGDLEILNEIEQMKWERSVFSVDKIEAIKDYNAKECELLVLLMQALFEAMDTAGIQLQRFDGAGAIASALLRKYDVRSHHGEPSSDALLFAQYAYSGARIEAPRIGNYVGKVWRKDINSAYPYAATFLPSYAGARWEVEPEWNGCDSSLVHVRWHITKEQKFYPLWYREHDGSILYPQWGEGIYYGIEFRNLLDYHEGEYEVIESCNVYLDNDIKPFDFVPEQYRIRLLFKKLGSMAHEALKLGLNSLYGKMAQQAGYRNGRIPTYHHLLWAGEITARTRRRLYVTAMEYPDSVIAFATDAIMSTAELSGEHTDQLGGWTCDDFTGITIVQPGVYWLRDNDGNWKDKYRGFDQGSLLREHIVGCWLLGQDYHARLRRFVGLGSALASKEFYDHWRKWEDQERVLGLIPGGKREPGPEVNYWNDLCYTRARANLNEGISRAYPLEWVDGPKDFKPRIDGVDLNTLEQEYIDSYA